MGGLVLGQRTDRAGADSCRRCQDSAARREASPRSREAVSPRWARSPTVAARIRSARVRWMD